MRRAALTALIASLPLLGAGAGVAQHRGALPASLFHGGARPLRVGPTPRGVSDTTAEACGACHAEIDRIAVDLEPDAA